MPEVEAAGDALNVSQTPWYQRRSQMHLTAIKKRKLRKKTKYLLLVTLSLLFLTGAAIYTVFIKPNQNTETYVYLETTVEKGDIKVGITENGTLDYGITTQMYDLDLSTETDENEDEEEEENLKYLIVEEVYIAPGERISEGDPVITFTDKSIEAVRRKLTSAKTEAEVTLEEAQADYKLSAISAKETYDLSREKASNADITWQYAAQAADSSIAQNQIELLRLQAEIELYQGKLEEAQEDYEDAEEDYQDAVAALEAVGTSNQLVTINFESTYLQAKSSLEQAENNLENIRNTIEQDQEEIETLSRQIETDSAAAQIDTLTARGEKNLADITGSVAAETYQASLENLQAGIDTAQETLDTLSDKLADFEDFIGDGTIYAEGSGIVTEVGYEAEDKLETSGTIVSFAKEGDMTITVDVSQEDITSLSVGDPVEIEFMAYEGQSYEGNILSITMTNTSSNSVTVSYPVEVSVNGDTSALYGGMSAEVNFVTEEHKDTLYVSKKAVIKQEGKTYVTVKKDGDYRLQEVEIGMSNSSSTEILSGLSAGDTVYIVSQVKNDGDGDDDNKENDNESKSPDSFGAPGTPGENGNGPGTDGSNMPDGNNPGGGMPDMNFGAGGVPGGQMPGRQGGMP